MKCLPGIPESPGIPGNPGTPGAPRGPTIRSPGRNAGFPFGPEKPYIFKIHISIKF